MESRSSARRVALYCTQLMPPLSETGAFRVADGTKSCPTVTYIGVKIVTPCAPMSKICANSPGEIGPLLARGGWGQLTMGCSPLACFLLAPWGARSTHGCPRTRVPTDPWVTSYPTESLAFWPRSPATRVPADPPSGPYVPECHSGVADYTRATPRISSTARPVPDRGGVVDYSGLQPPAESLAKLAPDRALQRGTRAALHPLMSRNSLPLPLPADSILLTLSDIEIVLDTSRSEAQSDGWEMATRTVPTAIPAFGPDCRETRQIAHGIDGGGLGLIWQLEGSEALMETLRPSKIGVVYCVERTSDQSASTIPG